MWIVFDLDAKPGVERALNDDGQPVIRDTVEEAIKDLGERIAFSMGYLADPDGNGPAPPLPAYESVRLNEFLRQHGEAPGQHTYLRYDTRDGYAHIMALVTPFAGAGFRAAGVAL